VNIIEQLKQTSVKGTELPKIKPAVSLVILVIGVILTLAFTYSSIRFAKTRELANFSESVKQTRLMVENKFQHYVFLLRSTAGLFIASDQLLPNEFDSFIDGLELEKNYPGIAEIGYFTVKDNEDDLEIEVVFGRAVMPARPPPPPYHSQLLKDRNFIQSPSFIGTRSGIEESQPNRPTSPIDTN